MCKKGYKSFKLRWWHWKRLVYFCGKNQDVPLLSSWGRHIYTREPAPRCAPQNLFGDYTFAPIYNPLDPNAWPKSRNGKKIHHPGTFKLSILQENKWEVGQTFEATLLTPSNVPPSGYGWIYRLLHKIVSNMK
jgi:hypothetical protein